MTASSPPDILLISNGLVTWKTSKPSSWSVQRFDSYYCLFYFLHRFIELIFPESELLNKKQSVGKNVFFM